MYGQHLQGQPQQQAGNPGYGPGQSFMGAPSNMQHAGQGWVGFDGAAGGQPAAAPQPMPSYAPQHTGYMPQQQPMSYAGQQQQQQQPSYAGQQQQPTGYYGQQQQQPSGYAGQQPGYVSQPTGYVPQQTGYMPQPGGYLPQQAPYQQQPAGYQPQHMGYQPQPQPATYQPQPTGYVPQPTGYMPQPTGYMPPQGGYVPQQTGYVPQQTGYMPPQAAGYPQQPQSYGGVQQYQSPQQPPSYTPQYTGYVPPQQQYMPQNVGYNTPYPAQQPQGLQYAGGGSFAGQPGHMMQPQHPQQQQAGAQQGQWYGGMPGQPAGPGYAAPGQQPVAPSEFKQNLSQAGAGDAFVGLPAMAAKPASQPGAGAGAQNPAAVGSGGWTSFDQDASSAAVPPGGSSGTGIAQGTFGAGAAGAAVTGQPAAVATRFESPAPTWDGSSAMPTAAGSFPGSAGAPAQFAPGTFHAPTQLGSGSFPAAAQFGSGSMPPAGQMGLSNPPPAAQFSTQIGPGSSFPPAAPTQTGSFTAASPQAPPGSFGAGPAWAGTSSFTAPQPNVAGSFAASAPAPVAVPGHDAGSQVSTASAFPTRFDDDMGNAAAFPTAPGGVQSTVPASATAPSAMFPAQFTGVQAAPGPVAVAAPAGMQSMLSGHASSVATAPTSPLHGYAASPVASQAAAPQAAGSTAGSAFPVSFADEQPAAPGATSFTSPPLSGYPSTTAALSMQGSMQHPHGRLAGMASGAPSDHAAHSFSATAYPGAGYEGQIQGMPSAGAHSSFSSYQQGMPSSAYQSYSPSAFPGGLTSSTHSGAPPAPAPPVEEHKPFKSMAPAPLPEDLFSSPAVGTTSAYAAQQPQQTASSGYGAATATGPSSIVGAGAALHQGPSAVSAAFSMMLRAQTSLGTPKNSGNPFADESAATLAAAAAAPVTTTAIYAAPAVAPAAGFAVTFDDDDNAHPAGSTMPAVPVPSTVADSSPATFAVQFTDEPDTQVTAAAVAPPAPAATPAAEFAVQFTDDDGVQPHAAVPPAAEQSAAAAFAVQFTYDEAPAVVAPQTAAEQTPAMQHTVTAAAPDMTAVSVAPAAAAPEAAAAATWASFEEEQATTIVVNSAEPSTGTGVVSTIQQSSSVVLSGAAVAALVTDTPAHASTAVPAVASAVPAVVSAVPAVVSAGPETSTAPPPVSQPVGTGRFSTSGATGLPEDLFSDPNPPAAVPPSALAAAAAIPLHSAPAAAEPVVDAVPVSADTLQQQATPGASETNAASPGVDGVGTFEAKAFDAGAAPMQTATAVVAETHSTNAVASTATGQTALTVLQTDVTTAVVTEQEATVAAPSGGSGWATFDEDGAQEPAALFAAAPTAPATVLHVATATGLQTSATAVIAEATASAVGDGSAVGPATEEVAPLPVIPETAIAAAGMPDVVSPRATPRSTAGYDTDASSDTDRPSHFSMGGATAIAGNPFAAILTPELMAAASAAAAARSAAPSQSGAISQTGAAITMSSVTGVEAGAAAHQPAILQAQDVTTAGAEDSFFPPAGQHPQPMPVSAVEADATAVKADAMPAAAAAAAVPAWTDFSDGAFAAPTEAGAEVTQRSEATPGTAVEQSVVHVAAEHPVPAQGISPVDANTSAGWVDFGDDDAGFGEPAPVAGFDAASTLPTMPAKDAATQPMEPVSGLGAGFTAPDTTPALTGVTTPAQQPSPEQEQVHTAKESVGQEHARSAGDAALAAAVADVPVAIRGASDAAADAALTAAAAATEATGFDAPFTAVAVATVTAAADGVVTTADAAATTGVVTTALTSQAATSSEGGPFSAVQATHAGFVARSSAESTPMAAADGGLRVGSPVGVPLQQRSTSYSGTGLTPRRSNGSRGSRGLSTTPSGAQSRSGTPPLDTLQASIAAAEALHAVQHVAAGRGPGLRSLDGGMMTDRSSPPLPVPTLTQSNSIGSQMHSATSQRSIGRTSASNMQVPSQSLRSWQRDDIPARGAAHRSSLELGIAAAEAAALAMRVSSSRSSLDPRPANAGTWSVLPDTGVEGQAPPLATAQPTSQFDALLSQGTEEEEIPAVSMTSLTGAGHAAPQPSQPAVEASKAGMQLSKEHVMSSSLFQSAHSHTSPVPSDLTTLAVGPAALPAVVLQAVGPAAAGHLQEAQPGQQLYQQPEYARDTAGVQEPGNVQQSMTPGGVDAEHFTEANELVDNQPMPAAAAPAEAVGWVSFGGDESNPFDVSPPEAAVAQQSPFPAADVHDDGQNNMVAQPLGAAAGFDTAAFSSQPPTATGAAPGMDEGGVGAQPQADASPVSGFDDAAFGDNSAAPWDVPNIAHVVQEAAAQTDHGEHIPRSEHEAQQDAAQHVVAQGGDHQAGPGAGQGDQEWVMVEHEGEAPVTVPAETAHAVDVPQPTTLSPEEAADTSRLVASQDAPVGVPTTVAGHASEQSTATGTGTEHTATVQQFPEQEYVPSELVEQGAPDWDSQPAAWATATSTMPRATEHIAQEHTQVNAPVHDHHEEATPAFDAAPVEEQAAGWTSFNEADTDVPVLTGTGASMFAAPAAVPPANTMTASAAVNPFEDEAPFPPAYTSADGTPPANPFADEAPFPAATRSTDGTGAAAAAANPFADEVPFPAAATSTDGTAAANAFAEEAPFPATATGTDGAVNPFADEAPFPAATTSTKGTAAANPFADEAPFPGQTLPGNATAGDVGSVEVTAQPAEVTQASPPSAGWTSFGDDEDAFAAPQLPTTLTQPAQLAAAAAGAVAALPAGGAHTPHTEPTASAGSEPGSGPASAVTSPRGSASGVVAANAAKAGSSPGVALPDGQERTSPLSASKTLRRPPPVPPRPVGLVRDAATARSFRAASTSGAETAGSPAGSPAVDVASPSHAGSPPPYDSIALGGHPSPAPPSCNSPTAGSMPPQATPSPPSHESVVGSTERGPAAPPSYDDVVHADTAARAMPPPPSCESVVAAGQGHLPPPPSYDSVVAADKGPAAPPSYESVVAADKAMPPPPPYEEVVSRQDQEMPPPPSYETVVAADKAQQALEQAPDAADVGCRGVALYLDPANCMDEQLHVEVRPRPLQPQTTRPMAQPKILVGGCHSLFAMPGLTSAGQAMLQWHLAGDHIGLPQEGVQATSEDIDAAPCAAVPAYESGMPPATHVLMDEVSGSMWTGHEDGRICRWSITPAGHVARCEQCFRAHTGSKVRGLALSPWGDLWTGSSAGTLRVWAYPNGILGLTSPPELTDLRRPGARRPHSKVLAVACSSSGRTMWSIGTTLAIIWSAYSGEYKGTLQLDAHFEGGATAGGGAQQGDEDIWIDPAKGLDAQSVHSEFKMRGAAPIHEMASSGVAGVAGAPGKESTTQGWKGMAAVSKFAVKLGKKINKTATTVSKNIQERAAKFEQAGAGGEEAGQGNDAGRERERSDKRAKLQAILASLDDSMLLVFKSGHVDKYTELGKLLWSVELRVKVKCAVLVERGVWVGAEDGCLRVLDIATGDVLACWPAHLARIKSLAVVEGIVYSLALDGSIKGWPVTQPPHPLAIDAWKDALRQGLRPHKLRVLAGTWNVATRKAQPRSVVEWLSNATQAHIVCVGLQEVEMGMGSVAQDAARTMLNKAALERGNTLAQWWADTILGAIGGAEAFTRVALRQMSGIMVLLYVRNKLLPYVGEVVTGHVACGVMGVAGNKGATAICLTLFRRRLVFLASHFAAHQEKVEERNADYAKIVRNLTFYELTPTPTSTNPGAPARHLSQPSQSGDSAVTTAVEPQLASEAVGFALQQAEAVIWMGDFNYRVKAPYQWVIDRAVAGSLKQMIMMDQAREEMNKGHVFHALSEGPLTFPPTYKFDDLQRNEDGSLKLTFEDGSDIPRYQDRGVLMPYDHSEKKRVPAWTDRILFRGSLPLKGNAVANRPEDLQVALAQHADGQPAYGCNLEVFDSDHKPVTADLDLLVPEHDAQQKRNFTMQVLSKVVRMVLPAEPAQAQLQLSGDALSYQRQGALPEVQLKPNSHDTIRIVNTSPTTLLMFTIGGAGKDPHASPSGGSDDAQAAWRLPAWLDVLPCSAVLAPGAAIIVKLQGPSVTPEMLAPKSSSPLISRHEVVLRVYAQHLLAAGGGHLNLSAQHGGQPLLLRVTYDPM